MTSRDFCFWLQGRFELTGNAQFSATETALIGRHLALVFKHEIDPSAGPAEHQAELSKIHDALKQGAKEAGEPTHEPIGGVGPNGELYRC